MPGKKNRIITYLVIILLFIFCLISCSHKQNQKDIISTDSDINKVTDDVQTDNTVTVSITPDNIESDDNQSGDLSVDNTEQVPNFIKTVIAGNLESIILTNDGDVWMSGCNSMGVLGDETTTNSCSTIKPQYISNFSNCRTPKLVLFRKYI